MIRVLFFASLAIVVALFVYGVKRGIVVFATPSSRELCVQACEPEGVARLALQIDRQGVLQGYSCECATP